jgi:hypothetical protein
MLIRPKNAAVDVPDTLLFSPENVGRRKLFPVDFRKPQLFACHAKLPENVAHVAPPEYLSGGHDQALGCLQKDGFAGCLTLLREGPNFGIARALLKLVEDVPILFRGSSYFLQRLALMRIGVSISQNRRKKSLLQEFKRIRLRYNIMLQSLRDPLVSRGALANKHMDYELSFFGHYA